MGWRGDRLKDKRKQIGLTKTELAHKVGVERQAVYMHEADKTEPKLLVLEQYAAILKTNVAYLMGEIDYDKPLSGGALALLAAYDAGDTAGVEKILLDRARQIAKNKRNIP